MEYVQSLWGPMLSLEFGWKTLGLNLGDVRATADDLVKI